jgi:hypothetical protein
MTWISLDDHLKGVDAKKSELSIVDTPASVAVVRNKGNDRTPEKCAVHAAAEKLARGAGRRFSATF